MGGPTIYILKCLSKCKSKKLIFEKFGPTSFNIVPPLDVMICTITFFIIQKAKFFLNKFISHRILLTKHVKVTFTKNKMLKFKLIKPYLKQIRLQEGIGLAILSNEEK